jgi:hypothetical protein
MARKKRESPFTGLWHIVSMSEWDEDYINEEVQAFMKFGLGGMGHSQFGLVSGNIDSLETQRDRPHGWAGSTSSTTTPRRPPCA